MEQHEQVAALNSLQLRKIVDLLATKRMYNMAVLVYTDNQYVPVAKGCFAFMFTNIGDTTAEVNGMVIYPSATPNTAIGDSRTISAHEMEIYAGNIMLSFRPTVGATNPKVELVQLFYL